MVYLVRKGEERREFLAEWEDRTSLRGNHYRVPKRDRQLRIPDSVLNNIVYLYPSREAADNNRNEGGSGFIVAVRSAVFPRWKAFPYIVTNRHVIENGSSVVRINTTDGGVDILDLKPADWKCSDPDDLAAIPLNASDCHDFSMTNVDALISEEEIRAHSVGPGDAVFMVGRFGVHGGQLSNRPSVRSGIISMMPGDPIRQQDGHEQISFLVEAHSIGGYSGSPVFVYISKLLPRPNVISLEGNQSWRLWLLGVDWGHLHDWVYVNAENGSRWPGGAKVCLNSGMMGVIPAWRLRDFLNCEDFRELRIKADDEFRKQKVDAGTLDCMWLPHNESETERLWGAVLRTLKDRVPETFVFLGKTSASSEDSLLPGEFMEYQIRQHFTDLALPKIEIDEILEDARKRS